VAACIQYASLSSFFSIKLVGLLISIKSIKCRAECSGIAQVRLSCDTLHSMLWSFAQSCQRWICKLRPWSDYIFRSISKHIRILQCVNTSLEKFVLVTVDFDSEISFVERSVRADAAKVLRLGYVGITNNLHEIADIRSSRLNAWWTRWWDLSTAFFLDLWATLLNRYNIVSMALQSSSVDLNKAIALLESLCGYVATLREQFDIKSNQINQFYSAPKSWPESWPT